MVANYGAAGFQEKIGLLYNSGDFRVLDSWNGVVLSHPIPGSRH